MYKLYFDPSRFLRLLRRDAQTMLRSLLLMGATYLGLMALAFLLFRISGERVADTHQRLFHLGLFGTALLLGGQAFRELARPGHAHLFLMLPVSRLERFLSRGLLTFLLPLVLMLALSLGGSGLVTLLRSAIWNETVPIFLPHQATGSVLIPYALVHSLVLLGAAFFREHVVPKTAFTAVATAVVLGALGALVFGGAMIELFGHFSTADSPAMTTFAYMKAVGPDLQRLLDLAQVVGRVLLYGLIPVAWLVGYLRLCEQEA